MVAGAGVGGRGDHAQASSRSARSQPRSRTRYRAWLERRAAGEPAHHLTGECEFWGRNFQPFPRRSSCPGPRPNSSIQVALDLPLSPTARVLDVGTGSGCIAVTLAAERPKWRVSAVDVVARGTGCGPHQRRRHEVEIDFHEADLTATSTRPGISSSPICPTSRPPFSNACRREVHHDPASALDGGPDGLDLVRRLIEDLPRLLRPCGGAVLEIGEDQADAVAALASTAGLGVARRIKDPGGCERVVVLQPR